MEGTEDSSEKRSHCCNTVFVKVLLSINRKMKVNPSILYVQVYYLIIGLSEIFQTPLTFTKNLFEKKLLPSGAISYSIASIFVDSSFFSRDYKFRLGFLRVFRLDLFVCIYVGRHCEGSSTNVSYLR